ncbi:MAG TPA: hypothetical protein VGM93_03080, partial [Acidimicrobiales bacterium]|jgi:hypothetical protein
VDQAFAEGPLIGRRDLPRGWRSVPMWNNEEHLDPWEGVPEAAAVRAARAARGLTALDEGAAWRDRDGRLLVLRVEAFAAPDTGAHRAAWQASAVACLDATWRLRWKERDHPPGWIEARPRPDAADREKSLKVPSDVDWYEVEDHTDPSGERQVTMYQHLTLWRDRGQIVVTGRHRAGDELDDVLSGLSRRLLSRLDGL